MSKIRLKYFWVYYHTNGLGRIFTVAAFVILTTLLFIYGSMGDTPSVYGGFVLLGLFLLYLLKCWTDETWEATYKEYLKKKEQ